MKKNKYQLLFVLCALATTFLGCDKDGEDLIDQNNKWEYLDSSKVSFVKFYQVFAGNSPTLPTAASATTGPQMLIYANGQKITGNSVGYGGIFPATNVYAAIPAGNTRFDIINGRLDLTVVPNIPKSIAGDTLASFNTTLVAGKNYSLFIGDTVPTVRVTLKEDKFTTPDVGTYKLRVANMYMNTVPTTDTVSLWSVRQNGFVISNVSHKEISDWVQLPVPIINDTIYFVRKGSGTPYVTGIAFLPTTLRSYTVMGRGKANVTGKTNAITFITNN